MGDKSTKAEVFAGLLTQGAIKQNVEILFTGAREAEAVKLFAFLPRDASSLFNELDSYALAGGMNSREIIEGVSLDLVLKSLQ